MGALCLVTDMTLNLPSQAVLYHFYMYLMAAYSTYVLDESGYLGVCCFREV